MSEPNSIADHYGAADLIGRVEEELKSAGLGDGPIPWKALAPLDQFHLMGAGATAELAQRLGLVASDHVLDVGCGLGGPSRQIASMIGCDVTGVDLNQPFVDLATMLTARTGLSDKVRHLHGDATSLPFEPGSFDNAITLHVGMNVEDKGAFYRGVFGALRPGGRLGIFDVTAGEAGPIHFPVPWARVAEDSFVVSLEEMTAQLEAAGFDVTEAADMTQAALAALPAQAAGVSGGAAPRLALPLVMGPEFPLMVKTTARNAAEGRIRLSRVIARRPL